MSVEAVLVKCMRRQIVVLILTTTHERVSALDRVSLILQLLLNLSCSQKRVSKWRRTLKKNYECVDVAEIKEIDKDMYVAGDRVGWSSIIEGNVVFILSS